MPVPFIRPARRTALAAGALLAVAGVALAGCAGGTTTDDGSAQTLTPVSIQLGWTPNVENMATIVAAEKGYFADEGIDITLLPGGPDVTADAQVAGGNALMGVLSAEALARSAAAGSGLVGLAATYQTTSSAIVTLADSGITEPSDLVGHTLGMSQTDQPVYDPFFRLVGVDPDQIERVMVGSDPAALASGEVDAITGTLANQPVALEQQGLDVVSIPLADYGYDRWSGVFVSRASSLQVDEERSLITSMLRAVRHGAEDAAADPEAAGQIVYDTYGADLGLDLDAQIAGAKIWAELSEENIGEHGLLYVDEAGLARLQTFFDTVGIDADTSELFDLSVEDEAFE